jgi:multidrug transporter EmrE-like cation transporter
LDRHQWTDRTKIIALLSVAVVSQAIGNVLLSQGMKLIGEESHPAWGNWMSIFLQAVHSPMILLGVGFLIVFFSLFTAALSRADLSFVLPALSSEVVITVACAEYFLDEAVSPARWLGALLISIGVVLVVRSSPRTFGIAGGQNVNS